MPENDFEKQVQQLFGDMKLKPSDAVWSRVHERITREKKRRRVLLWLPLLLLLSAGGIYLITGDNKRSAEGSLQELHANAGGAATTGTANKSGQNMGSNNASSERTGTAATSSLPSSTADDAGTGANTGTPLPADTKLEGKAEKNDVQRKPQGRSLEGNIPGIGISKQGGNSRSGVKRGTGSIVDNNINKTNKGATATTGDAEADLNEISARPATGIQQNVDGYKGLKEIESEKTLKHFANAPIISSNKPVVKLAKRKSWEWGISGQAGASTVGKGLSGVFSNGLFEKSQYNYAASPVTSPDLSFLGNQNNYLAAAPPPASAIKTGMAWNAGGFGKWYIKDRLALTFGAEYSLYTTSREVGSMVVPQYNLNGASQDVNARFAAYYTGGNGVNYTNKYHFVQVPLGIQWQVNKGIKLPLQVDAGLALAYLVNTNAVHYRSNTGVYYEDKSLFNKLQTGLYAGFSVKLFQHTERPLYIGPLVQYNLSNTTKSSTGLKQNFMYAGLKIQWVLWKN